MKTFTATHDLRAALAAAQESTIATDLDATVETCIERWLTVHSIGNKARSVQFNQEIAAKIRQHWPDLKTKAGEVTPAQCITFAESVGHFSSSRYNGMVNAVRSFCPAAKFIPRKRLKILDVATACPTPQEFDRLLAALDCALRGRAGLVVRFLAHTGMRITEATKLTWADVKEDHIYARAETTKNGKPRTIPFVPGTREVLRALKRHAKTDSVLPQVCCKTALLYASRLTGLPRYSHHDFRHYFATRCIVSGVDIPTVAKWLGHSDNGVLLLRTYCHLMDEHSSAMAKKVSMGANLANPETFVELHAPRNAASATENIIPLIQLSAANAS